MALKHFITFLLIGVLVMAIPQAKAQLGLEILEGLLGLVNIQGTVFCTHKDKIDVKGGTTPVFPSKATIHCYMHFSSQNYFSYEL